MGSNRPVGPSWIEVLGAVRAWQGRRELPLGSPQQRGVLVLLALAEGRPVTVPRIMDALWGTRPPRAAANVVRTYLKRLRQALEPDRPPRGASRVLPSAAGGYALRAEPDTVDVWVFRRQIRQARQARRARDLDRLGSALGNALALWHGPPGGELGALVDGHRLQVPVLEEHGAAVDWFAELSLATGTAATALPVVLPVAAARPFDQPLHATLIRLFHALGRRSDAVRVYQRSRRRLSDEFGSEPGPELTTAYRELVRDQHQPTNGAGR